VGVGISLPEGPFFDSLIVISNVLLHHLRLPLELLLNVSLYAAKLTLFGVRHPMDERFCRALRVSVTRSVLALAVPVDGSLNALRGRHKS
jgi:hypothetical protein